MNTVKKRVYLNTHDIPVRKENESVQDFNARMEYFRKTDLRISIPNMGMVNFAFDHCYTVGVGTIGNGDDKPRIKMVNGEIDYSSVTYNPQRGGYFSIK